jgi:ATP-dependent DNA helicase RecG
VLFGVRPEALRPAWRVTALRISGRELAAPVVDSLETEGPAPQAIAQVTAFLQRNLAGPSHEGQRPPDYPLAAVREVVANAVAHRDYAAPAQVFVRIFDDRLEVESPGGLFSGATLETLLTSGESRPRNPLIAETLRRMGLMAEAGRGLALIQEESARLGAPPPEFAADARRFWVVLHPKRT